MMTFVSRENDHPEIQLCEVLLGTALIAAQNRALSRITPCMLLHVAESYSHCKQLDIQLHKPPQCHQLLILAPQLED